MTSNKHTKDRKIWLFLPVIALPILSGAFWALGGGQGTGDEVPLKETTLKATLPDAHFDEKNTKEWDKLSIYQRAQRDSLKAREARKNDPYFRLKTLDLNKDSIPGRGKINSSLGEKPSNLEATEEALNKKVKELNRHLEQESTTPAPRSIESPSSIPADAAADLETSPEVRQLEAMMQMMQSSHQPDHEMEEIDAVLEKILDIQHPERVKEKIRNYEERHSNDAFQVKKAQEVKFTSLGHQHEEIDSPFDKGDKLVSNGFFGVEDPEATSTHLRNGTFRARFIDTQELISGGTVKMELAEDVQIENITIPKNHFVFGTATLNGERLLIAIKSIQLQGQIYPVDLSVFGPDGMEGVFIPGALSRDAAKQSSNQALQEIELFSMDPSIGTQAANVGVQAAKGLLSRKAKAIKITIKAGHRIFLKNNNYKP